jgi:hypothetical protein
MRATMRFIVMHKVDANMEAGGPPSQDIIRGMGKLVGTGLKSGIFLDGAGLHRSAARVRLRFKGGACKVAKGPYAGENELIAGLAMIKTTSMDAAVERARRFGDVIPDGEVEIGPVVEPWDLGMIPKPADLDSGRFLLLFKGDTTPPLRAAMRKLSDELAAEGVLLRAEQLASSSQGARLASGAKEKRAWVDGPFAESKEMIAGFSILNVKSKEEAIAWASEYAEILGDNEVDVRLMLPDGEGGQ